MTGRSSASRLPIDDALPKILDQIQQHRNFVLVAQPGAGKTTRVAPALLRANLLDSRAPNIVLLQPRRVATRSVAARIAEENGWNLGEEVGYHVRFERKLTHKTRLRVMTEGILNRQLVNDPFLEGVGAVLLDEFHERSIHTDLALALLREIQSTVREDLIIGVMSATLDADPVARYLNHARVHRVEGRTFPVTVSHQGNDGRPLVERMADVLRRELATGDKRDDILAFLPGVEEIRRVARSIGETAASLNAVVLPLHGSLTPEEQDAALRPNERRKVVLATNIAETSLTIDGITLVVDSGLARVASFDASTGVDRLQLSRISRASADQRAGRAGRTQAGRCIRLWSLREERGMAASTPPEVERIDLSSTLLAIHAFGASNPASFGWFEVPPTDRLESANQLLERLGAVDAQGKMTSLGRDLLDLPTSPRLALLLREFHGIGRLREGATIAALLGERDLMSVRGRNARPETHGDNDLAVRIDRLEEAERARFSPSLRDNGIDPSTARNVARSRDDFLRIARRWPELGIDSDGNPEKAILRAFPDRVCRRRKVDPATGLMVGGRAVRLDTQSVVREGEFFLAIDPREGDQGPGREAIVRIAVAIEPEWLSELFPDAVRTEVIARFDEDRQRVMGVKRTQYHDLTLKESEHVAVDPDVAAEILFEAVKPNARTIIAQHEAAATWLVRFDLLCVTMPELELPAFSDEALQIVLREACRGCKSVDELKKLAWVDLLKGELSYAQSRLVDEYVPETLTVPSGSKLKIVYEEGRPPVLAARLQELFGWVETPRLALGRVPVVLHLLGPNFRPVQVTDDLRSFWATTYFQVRKDLRNRYPKHAWPENPLTATAEAKGSRRQS